MGWWNGSSGGVLKVAELVTAYVRVVPVIVVGRFNGGFGSGSGGGCGCVGGDGGGHVGCGGGCGCSRVLVMA